MKHEGNIDELRRLAAGRDPRQTHFVFYAESDPSTSAPEPEKRQPSQAGGFAEPVSEITVQVPHLA
jgi:hypothetical protein